jgi:hypothetical protein
MYVFSELKNQDLVHELMACEIEVLKFRGAKFAGRTGKTHGEVKILADSWRPSCLERQVGR